MLFTGTRDLAIEFEVRGNAESIIDPCVFQLPVKHSLKRMAIIRPCRVSLMLEHGQEISHIQHITLIDSSSTHRHEV